MLCKLVQTLSDRSLKRHFYLLRWWRKGFTILLPGQVHPPLKIPSSKLDLERSGHE